MPTSNNSLQNNAIYRSNQRTPLKTQNIKTTEYGHIIYRMEKETAKTTVLYRSINKNIVKPLFTKSIKEECMRYQF